MVLNWWRTNWRSMAYGTAAGVLWGFLAAGAATPREWLVLDQGAGLVYLYNANSAAPRVLPVAAFYQDFYSNLIQGTLIFLVLAGAAGWATWQLRRIKPRGQEQVSLREGLDWYLIALAIAGLATVVVYHALGLAVWFKGAWNTPAGLVSVGLGFVLPFYAGIGVFMVWFLRLPTVRAPDWETHYPKPKPRSLRRWWPLARPRKGGDRALDE